MIANQASLLQPVRCSSWRIRMIGDDVHDQRRHKNMMGDELPLDTRPTEPLAHMDALPVGTMVGEFELQGLLGVGGFGMVYRGYDHSLHRAVAIKEYMPSALVGRAPGLQVSARSNADTQSYLTGLASFMAEARLLAQFDHPSLVKVYRVWEENNTAYMAMPLYSGITLKQARQMMSGPPPETWLRAILWSVLEALKVLHAAGALHRDVSPDNIFLQDVGPPVLLDLGAARLAVTDNSQKHTAILKVNYAPIEQYADAQDMKEGPWTDLYALAAVVHGCLCNEPPLPANFRVVRDRMPSIVAVVKTVETHFGQSYSHAFVRAINHALAIQPSKRTKDANAFARELRLRTPKHMAHFDWRARLGDGVTLGAPQAGLDGGVHLPTRPHVSGAQAQAAFASLVGAASHKPDGTIARPLRWLRGHALGLAGVLTLVAVIFGVYLYASAPGNTAPAAAAVNPQPVAAAAPLVPASEVIIDEVVVHDDMAPTLQQPQAPSTPSPPAARVPSPTTHPANTARTTIGSSRAQTPSRGAGNSGAAALTLPAKPPPVVRELCASSGILTRPMCIYRECQKPEFADLPVCVEDRKRWEKRDREQRP
jgi:non-specific serine/threonine protein kinase